MLCLSLHIAPCNVAIRSLLVAWSSNCCIAASSTKSMVASFKTSALKEVAAETGSCSAPVQFMWTTIGFTEKLSADVHPHRAHIHVVLIRKTPLQQQFYSQ